MKRKDILELKKRLKKDQCTFTRMCGCFVNAEKNIILELKETFLNLDEDDYFKYLEIARKVLSGTVGNNILALSFPEGQISEKQTFLNQLKKSKLKDDELINEFYKTVIDNYIFEGNYLILLFHDVYDIITKTTDNLKIDESEEVFEYVLCAICPVSLSAPGLSYFEDENKIKSRLRDWIVDAPTNGFIYPAFIDRGPDVNSIMYYTKNAKDTHPELMKNTLGCSSKDTSAMQKEKFQYIVKDSIVADEEVVDELYMKIQENLNTIVEDHKLISDDLDNNPVKLTKDGLQNILIESGVPQEYTSRIEKYYEDEFNDDVPLVENLIDGKILIVNELRKNERNLEKQVEFLKDKLDQFNPGNIDYDIVLHVRPEKIDEIKTQTLDGQEYLVIPVSGNEKTRIQEIK
ncbi:DUF4317 domain-containing protein [Tissierella creatinini]|nr:DUF4317 domain-containing protein [Tissierella creatinini]TJX63898.1 DUF4317 domain-containing protein [Soehngenia saccharolytica]